MLAVHALGERMLGESLDAVQLLGGALIIGSVASLQLEGRLARPEEVRASAPMSDEAARAADRG